jgi:PKD repeat protein
MQLTSSKIYNALCGMALVTLIVACEKLQPKPEVEACFSINRPIDSLKVNDTLVFDASCSKNAEKYVWNFGDGTTLQNGTTSKHVFKSASSFLVTLKATKDGDTNTTVKQLVLFN